MAARRTCPILLVLMISRPLVGKRLIARLMLFAGAIQESTNSYVGPFLVSGSLIALGGIICLPVRRIAAWEAARDKKSRGKYNVVNTNY
jgi:hypothetical protein